MTTGDKLFEKLATKHVVKLNVNTVVKATSNSLVLVLITGPMP